MRGIWSLLAPALTLALALAGCAPPDVTAFTAAAGLAPTTYDGGPFVLHAWERGRTTPGETVRVYIEGDGRAYVTRFRPSSDPTPRDPLALRLAAADPFPRVVALARPCQYVTAAEARGCAVEVWTTGRFAPSVIAGVSRALDGIKAAFQARRLELVGYSGGAAVAVLVAAQRTDVAALVTVAGVLDAGLWTGLQQVSPLAASLEPAAVAAALAAVPQTHLAGTEDAVVPLAVPASFARRSGGRSVHAIAGATHHCCWVEQWPALLAAYPPR